MNTYNSIVKKCMMNNNKIPTLTQYLNNKYYYDNKEKIKQNKLKRKLLNKYGYICYTANRGFFVYDENNNIVFT